MEPELLSRALGFQARAQEQEMDRPGFGLLSVFFRIRKVSLRKPPLSARQYFPNTP
jgi:hypothetical protein